MLILSRKECEQIVIGDEICIKVLSIRGNTVRLGIEAPNSVSILRAEIIARDSDTSQSENRPVARFAELALDSAVPSEC